MWGDILACLYRHPNTSIAKKEELFDEVLMVMIYFDFLQIMIIKELWSWLFQNLKESTIWGINPETRTKQHQFEPMLQGY
jgi:hypothetical protein